MTVCGEMIHPRTGRLVQIWAAHRTLEASNDALESDLAEGVVSWGEFDQIRRGGFWLTVLNRD